MATDGLATVGVAAVQADTLGVPVSRPKMVETTALGSAIAAGLAVGVWDSPKDPRLGQMLQVEKDFHPPPDDTGDLSNCAACLLI